LPQTSREDEEEVPYFKKFRQTFSPAADKDVFSFPSAYWKRLSVETRLVFE